MLNATKLQFSRALDFCTCRDAYVQDERGYYEIVRPDPGGFTSRDNTFAASLVNTGFMSISEFEEKYKFIQDHNIPSCYIYAFASSLELHIMHPNRKHIFPVDFNMFLGLYNELCEASGSTDWNLVFDRTRTVFNCAFHYSYKGKDNPAFKLPMSNAGITKYTNKSDLVQFIKSERDRLYKTVDEGIELVRHDDFCDIYDTLESRNVTTSKLSKFVTLIRARGSKRVNLGMKQLANVRHCPDLSFNETEAVQQFIRMGLGIKKSPLSFTLKAVHFKLYQTKGHNNIILCISLLSNLEFNMSELEHMTRVYRAIHTLDLWDTMVRKVESEALMCL